MVEVIHININLGCRKKTTFKWIMLKNEDCELGIEKGNMVTSDVFSTHVYTFSLHE